MSDTFKTLNSVDVSRNTEQKGNFTYLSWAFAVRELLKVVPEATWDIHEYGPEDNRRPYMQTPAGCFVKVTVYVDGVGRTQVHPVLDNRNSTVNEPDAFQINTSIMRCLTKAISLHGLGLYIYAGEDLPTVGLTPEQQSHLEHVVQELSKVDSDSAGKVEDNLKNGGIDSTNYKKTVNWMNSKINNRS